MPEAATSTGGGLGAAEAWFRPARRRSALLLGAAAAAAALAAGMAYPNPTPQFDEFFHLLVADSMRAGRGLKITAEAEPYDRAWLFSHAVFQSQQLLGPTMWAARLPSALCWALTLGGVACWLARRVGLAAATLTALLLGFSIHALMYATMVRFYTPQALFVWVAAACVESAVPRLRPAAGAQPGEASEPGGRRRLERSGPPGRRGRAPDGGGPRASGWRAAGYLLLGAAAGVVALSLQPTTLIAAGAAGLWLLGAWFWYLALRPGRPSVRLGVAAGTVLGLTLLGVGLWLGLVRAYFEQVTAGTRVWAAADAADAWFYLRTMTNWYGPALTGLPLFAAVALLRGGPQAWRRRRAIGFLLVLGLLPVLIHSLVPTKAFRYVFYALPFLFAVTGIGLAEGLRAAAVGVRAAAPGGGFRRGAAAAVAVLAVLAAGTLALRRAPGFTWGVTTALGFNEHAPYHRSDWVAALPVLRPVADRVDCVVSSAGNKALFWFGRLDLNLSRTLRLDPDPDWIQPQDGRRVITEPEEVLALRDAHRSGLVVIETPHWRQDAFVGSATADALEEGFTRIPLDPAWGLLAFGWGGFDEAPGVVEPGEPAADPPDPGR